MKTTTYSIDDSNGNLICSGIEEHVSRTTAQRLADDRREAVTLYSHADDGVVFEPAATGHTHHCDECGAEVDESCEAHPSATVVSVL